MKTGMKDQSSTHLCTVKIDVDNLDIAIVYCRVIPLIGSIPNSGAR